MSARNNMATSVPWRLLVGRGFTIPNSPRITLGRGKLRLYALGIDEARDLSGLSGGGRAPGSWRGRLPGTTGTQTAALPGPCEASTVTTGTRRKNPGGRPPKTWRRSRAGTSSAPTVAGRLDPVAGCSAIGPGRASRSPSTILQRVLGFNSRPPGFRRHPSGHCSAGRCRYRSTTAGRGVKHLRAQRTLRDAWADALPRLSAENADAQQVVTWLGGLESWRDQARDAGRPDPDIIALYSR